MPVIVTSNYDLMDYATEEFDQEALGNRCEVIKFEVSNKERENEREREREMDVMTNEQTEKQQKGE